MPLEFARPSGCFGLADISSSRADSAPFAHSTTARAFWKCSRLSLVEVRDAGGAALCVGFDPAHVTERPHLATSRRLGLRNHVVERRGLGRHLAAETHAEPTVCAGVPSAIGHRRDGHRGGVGVQAELARAALEQHARRLHRQRRHRIRPAARRVERTRAGESRNADLPVDFRVIRLEFRIVDGPVVERRAGNRAEQRSLLEIDLVKAPEIAGEVHTAAADDRRVPGGRESLHALRNLVRRLAERLRIGVELVADPAVEPVVEFVVTEIGGRVARALFEHQHLEAGL